MINKKMVEKVLDVKITKFEVVYGRIFYNKEEISINKFFFKCVNYLEDNGQNISLIVDSGIKQQLFSHVALHIREEIK